MLLKNKQMLSSWNLLRQMVTAVWELARSWYRGDRIRVAPSDGRLFQIRKGVRLLIRNRLYEVVTGSESGGNLRCVVYELACDEAAAGLTVQLTETNGSWQAVVKLHFRETVESLSESEVVVLTT